MVGCETSNFRPPVATKVSIPFTDNCMASGFLRNTERLAEIVDDVGGGFDADRQSHQFLADAGGLELGGIHLLMGGRGGMNDQRLGVADIGQMADYPERLGEFLGDGAGALG